MEDILDFDFADWRDDELLFLAGNELFPLVDSLVCVVTRGGSFARAPLDLGYKTCVWVR